MAEQDDYSPRQNGRRIDALDVNHNVLRGDLGNLERRVNLLEAQGMLLTDLRGAVERLSTSVGGLQVRLGILSAVGGAGIFKAIEYVMHIGGISQ